MRRYKFVFAFENAIQPDYVTEKFYIPLMAGAVPVYLGAPNIKHFAPDPHSYIDVNDFASPEALAHHLLHLHANPKEYARLHAWRERAWSLDFRRIAEQALNQGHIYNEGAVHGSAQRVSPLRLSSALTSLYLADLERGVDEAHIAAAVRTAAVAVRTAAATRTAAVVRTAAAALVAETPGVVPVDWYGSGAVKLLSAMTMFPC
jgi:hypothetical protein